MGGLVVKQMLYQAKAENKDNFVNNTVGVVRFLLEHDRSHGCLSCQYLENLMTMFVCFSGFL